MTTQTTCEKYHSFYFFPLSSEGPFNCLVDGESFEATEVSLCSVRGVWKTDNRQQFRSVALIIATSYSLPLASQKVTVDVRTRLL